MDEDRPLYKDIEDIKQWILSGGILEAVGRAGVNLNSVVQVAQSKDPVSPK